MNSDFCKEKNGWIGFCGVRLMNIELRSSLRFYHGIRFIFQSFLFYKKISKRNNEILFVVNTDSLAITCKTNSILFFWKFNFNICNFSSATIQISMPSCKEGQNCLLFSDEDSLNAICSIKDVSFSNKTQFDKIFKNVMFILG